MVTSPLSRTMTKPQIFVSHISEEADLAAVLKRHLVEDFLDLTEVFVSSDIQSISAGQNWLEILDAALRRSSLLLVLCSDASLRRPWVNFEIGAAWMKQIPIVPICHSGLEPSSLPIPLSLLQGIQASHRDGTCPPLFGRSKGHWQTRAEGQCRPTNRRDCVVRG